jgi:hypothetical protein
MIKKAPTPEGTIAPVARLKPEPRPKHKYTIECTRDGSKWYIDKTGMRGRRLFSTKEEAIRCALQLFGEA